MHHVVILELSLDPCVLFFFFLYPKVRSLSKGLYVYLKY